MNKERLLKLADVVEKTIAWDGSDEENTYEYDNDLGIEGITDPKSGDMLFDMSTWGERYQNFHECRTVGCLAGHAIRLWPKEALEIYKKSNGCTTYSRVASQLLGLDGSTGSELFIPVRIGNIKKVTPHEGATVLRLVADGVRPDDAWDDIRKMRDE